ncbi:hypothetical protein PR048_011789 [Dryococelus australis]|uniref:Uncharacterized protein n=1 Tax=Dryococelus australis TaxID=614101 RepID=A0ABQ9HNB5_9NEOP|nr:hypothetical protein PR048_011789 [Dryococelus australis]
MKRCYSTMYEEKWTVSNCVDSRSQEEIETTDRQLTEEFEDDEALDFSEFSINIQNIMAEFNIRFQDFKGMKSSILLFNNPLGVVIQEQPSNLQLELCDLQADAFLQTKTEKGPAFFKLISSHRFPHLCDFG